MMDIVRMMVPMTVVGIYDGLCIHSNGCGGGCDLGLKHVFHNKDESKELNIELNTTAMITPTTYITSTTLSTPATTIS